MFSPSKTNWSRLQGSLPVVFLMIAIQTIGAFQAVAENSSNVPQQVQFAGRIEATTGMTGASFSLYADKTGGAALWMETQNVRVDEAGSYTVLLGTQTPGGIPQDLFAMGEARWLEVSYTAADGTQVTQPRVLLVSVPYALKAGDATTLGGLPAAAFVLNSNALNARVAAAGNVLPSTAVAGTGTANKIAKWIDGTGTLGDSLLFDNGLVVGIGTTTPGAALHISLQDASIILGGAGTHSLSVQGSGSNGRLGQDNDGFFFSSDTNGKALKMLTQSNNVLQEWMRITAGGLIGMGTQTPGAALHLSQQDASFLIDGLGTHSIALQGPGSNGRFGQDGEGMFFASDTNGRAFKFLTSNGVLNEWMRITPSGNVGIGTTTPSAALEVNGGVKMANIQITGGTPGAGKVLTSDATGNGTWQASSGGGGGGTATDVNCVTPCISEGEIANGAIATAKLADSAVTSLKIADGTVTTDDIAVDTITSVDIANGAIGNAELGDNVVTSIKINNGTILNEDLADDVITWNKMADNSVGNAELRDHVVTSIKINNGAILNEDLADDVITWNKMADNSVGNAELINHSVTSIKINDGTILNEDLADNIITWNKMADNSVGNVELVDNAVTSIKINDSSVTTDDIALDTITAFDIANGAVGNGELADSAVTSIKIADGTITTEDIAFDTITAADIANGAVTSNEILDGSILNEDINISAAIAPSKISGTAAILLGGNNFQGNQSINGTITASGSLAVDISTLVVDAGTDRVGMGTATPQDRLHVDGNVRVTGCLWNGTTVYNGSCASDIRFKRNIRPFAASLDQVARLQPVRFEWRTEEYPTRRFGRGLSSGLIAQEVEQILPDLVTTDEQGYKAVDYSQLPLLAIQAVRELKAQNDNLKAQLAAQQLELATMTTKTGTQQAELGELREMLLNLQRQLGTQVSKVK